MKKLSEIARVVGGKVIGNPDVIVTGVSGIEDARKGDITFLSNPKYIKYLSHTSAVAVVLSPRHKNLTTLPRIVVSNPDLASIKIAELFQSKRVKPFKGIHPTAIIDKKVIIGKRVSIGAYAIIEYASEIGDGSIIYPSVYIGQQTKIGKNCIIYPQVVIRENSIIGNNVIIHSGAVLGSDGFGYVTLRGVHKKIPHIGIVQVEDDCEIGANVTIDRARFGKTILRKGTKIDNLVHIAHNVEIGEHSLLAGQVGIAGSAKIGKYVSLGGQAGVRDHIKIGDKSSVAAQAGVSRDLPPGSVVSGWLARDHKKVLEELAALSKLPGLLLEFKELKQKIEKLYESQKI